MYCIFGVPDGQIKINKSAKAVLCSTVFVAVHTRACISHAYVFISSNVDGSGSTEVERAPFLAKPVRLTPAWEANNLPNDELNFRGTILFCHFN